MQDFQQFPIKLGSETLPLYFLYLSQNNTTEVPRTTKNRKIFNHHPTGRAKKCLKMSQVNKKITRNTPATNKVLACTGSLIQLALFKEISVTNYKTLVRSGTNMRNSSIFLKMSFLFSYRYFFRILAKLLWPS